MSKRKLIGWSVLAAVAGAAAIWLPMPANSPSPVERDPKSDRTSQPAQGERFAALPQREAIGKAERPLFASRSWQPAQPTPVAAPEPAAPTVPPMPYRVAGTVQHGKTEQIVLARGDAVLAVREGDTLDGAYRIESIRPDHVTLVYLPLGVSQDLAVSSTFGDPKARGPVMSPTGVAGAQAPAKVTWDGPQRVRAGDPFKVALKLTSSEAVRSAPLQISFDPELVRPIAVRAGDFFSGGMFSYRVNPAGSISVGASGKGAVPADAEFLVVNFEPIRPAGTAEFSLSSLDLQDMGGRAIAYQQPSAFRTTIVR